MHTLERWPYAPDLRTRALHFAHRYDAMIREADALIEQAPVMDGMPRSTRTGDPVAGAVIRRERIRQEISIIENALLDIEPEYRAGIIENICRCVPMHMLDFASESTWKRKRRMVLAGIVERAGWSSSESPWSQA